MGTLSPERYAKAHGIDPVVFERWIRTRLIFRPECGGRAVREPVRRRTVLNPAKTVAGAEFVPMTLVGEESPC